MMRSKVKGTTTRVSNETFGTYIELLYEGSCVKMYEKHRVVIVTCRNPHTYSFLTCIPLGGYML